MGVTPANKSSEAQSTQTKIDQLTDQTTVIHEMISEILQLMKSFVSKDAAEMKGLQEMVTDQTEKIQDLEHRISQLRISQKPKPHSKQSRRKSKTNSLVTSQGTSVLIAEQYFHRIFK